MNREVPIESAQRVPPVVEHGLLGARSRNWLIDAERWSSRLVWVSGVLLVAVVAKNAWEARSIAERARAMRCDQPIFTFGQAFVGDNIDHTFHVVNVGRQPIQISRVWTECGCTAVGIDLNGRLIEPQQSFDVPVRLALSTSEAGNMERKVIVEFADKPGHRLLLKLTGRVEPRWSWSPQLVVFDALSASQQSSRVITVTRNRDLPPATIERVDSSASWLHAEFERCSSCSDARSWRITVSTVPPLVNGRQDAVLEVQASDSPTSIGPIRVTRIVTE